LKPCPQLSRTDVACAEAQTTDQNGAQHRNPWRFESVESAEKGGSVFVDRQTVEEPGSSEKRMVTSGYDAGHDDGVDKTPRNRAAGLLENDSERACSAIPRCEVGIGVWNI
jgi:hypothetical protein